MSIHEIPLELKQKKLGECRQFFLEPNQIRLIVKNLNGKNEFYCNYENIGPRTRNVTLQKGILLLLAVVISLVALVELILGLIIEQAGIIVAAIILGCASFVLIGIHFYRKRSYLFVELNNKKNMLFIADKPSAEQLASFIKSLYEARRDFCRSKYFIVDPDDEPAEQLLRLKWLLAQELISEDEYQQKKHLLTNNDYPL